MTFVVRAYIFVFLTLVFTIGVVIFYASGHTDAEVGWLSITLIVVLSMAAAALFGSLALSTRREADRYNAAVHDYIDALEQSRVFSVPIAVPGLHLEQGEFIVRHDHAALAELRRARIGGGLGTRVHVGGFPIYLGGWKSVPHEEVREVGTGELVLTNRRLLFIGAHTLAIPFDHLLTCQQADAGLMVSENRNKTPHVFVPEMAGLWCFLVNWVVDNRFEHPKLPEGMHLSVTGEAPELQIHVTGDEASHTEKRGLLGNL